MTVSILFNLLGIFGIFIFALITYLKWKLNYWQNLKIPTITPSLPFGNMKSLLMGRQTFGEQFRDLYHEFKRKGHIKHAGVYMSTNPFYLTIDPELVKHVMQLDFDYFVNHINYINEDADPLSGHLFNLEDAKWRNMRAKMSPTFTSKKMKMMFDTVMECTVPLIHIIDESATECIPVDIKEILSRFTTDVIGSVAFGLECNSLKNPDAEFRKYGRLAFETGTIDRIRFLLTFAMPHDILRALKFRLTKKNVENFYMNVVQETVDYREKNDIFRKDFLHLLIQIKNRGIVSDDHKIKNEHQNTEKGLTMNELTAQAFVFFLAGFETSSTTISFALFELAAHPDVQEKVRNEINTVLATYNNNITYEGIMEMSYMEKVLCETLRKYPPVPVMTRRCTKDYKIPDTSIVLPKGAKVAIPVLALQTDPEYFPNPDKFDPERFSEENKSRRHPFTWIPFGEGPRICIGLRFGMMESKIGLTTILKNYRFKVSKKTSLPLRLDTNLFITTAKGGIWLDVEKIN